MNYRNDWLCHVRGDTSGAVQPRRGQIVDSVAPRPSRYCGSLTTTWGMLPRLHRLENTAALKGEEPGDNASFRGPACDGCGHVDRLIT